MKIWSMNSPLEAAVFQMDKAERWARQGRARIIPLKDAMAIHLRTDQKRWTRGWMRRKFAIPDSCGDAVLVFNGDFVMRMRAQAHDQEKTAAADRSFDQMVDDGRRPDGNVKEGVGVWTSRPSQRSKVAGAPVQKVRSMRIVYPSS